ncbi:MAG TPA: prepilin-type N-terminal cleavage/methylation domain-containing protein [Marinagarivorans sp.]
MNVKHHDSAKGKPNLPTEIKHSGFSIVELMIVVLIMGLALVKGIPLTVDWVNSARVTEAESALVEAVGLAKAKALRNSQGVIDGSAVTAVCYGNARVSVVEAAAANSPAQCAGGSTEIWKKSLNGNVDIAVGGTAFACLCVDAKARLSVLGSCNACSTSTTFALSAGGISDSVEIY